jgi:hypothetical protein
LIASATALVLLQVKARSSDRATVDKVRPGRNGVDNPMIPDKRTTGTTTLGRRKRRGKTDPKRRPMRWGNVVSFMPTT